MRNISTALLVSSLFLTAPAFAGGGHDHGPGGSHVQGPISAAVALKKAGVQVKTLIERGKLDKTWADAKASEATQKDFGRGTEWIVAIKNEKATDPAKQTLYVFFTANGNYLATNFTGK